MIAPRFSATLACFVGLMIQSTEALACVGCGQTTLFSPKTLGISMSFILLPVTIVGLIGWKLVRDTKADVAARSAEGQKEPK